jgi:hypothetical protein
LIPTKNDRTRLHDRSLPLNEHYADRRIALREFGPLLLFHDQHRTLDKLNNPIGAAADHSFIKGGMAGGADDKQVGLDLGRKFDDIANRVSSENVGKKLDMALFGHLTRALQDTMEASCRPAGLLSNILDELWHVVNFHD